MKKLIENKVIDQELPVQIYKKHIIACKVAIFINLIWSIINYFVLYDNNLYYLIGGGIISLVIYLILILRDKLKISAEVLGFIPMLLIGVFYTFIYSQLPLVKFQKFTFIYAAIFLGAGMFLVWSIKYSILTIVTLFMTAGVFFITYSSLSLEAILLNGGILSLSMAFFMVIAIYTRHQLIFKEISSKTTLLEKQKQLENTVQDLLNYKTALDESAIVSTTDAKGLITYANKKFCDISKYTEAELLGQDHRIVNSGYHTSDFFKKLWATIGKGVIWNGEIKNKAKDGSTYWVDTTITPFLDSNKKPYQYLVIRKDITRIKLIQEELEESEKEQRLLFEYNPTAMFIFSDKKKQILEVNLKMEESYGYDKKAFRKLDVVDELLYENMCQIIKKDDDEIREWKHINKSGDSIIVKAKMADVYFKGEKMKLISINDITASKLNEMNLEKAKKQAEIARDHQSQFLSNMSHEIRTPMNGILGLARLLQKTKQTKEQERYIKAIYTSSDNLMVIINDILDSSKIEAGKLEIEHIPFSINELIHSWGEILKFKAEDKKVAFNINVNSNVPDGLVGDPIRLNQIIYNLAGNAIKFTKTGSVDINISVLKEYEKKIALQFDVKDTGIGIAKDKLDDVFSSFTQANSNTTREYGGTGLGLTITKELIKLQDGKIWVDSKLNEGSTFSFILEYDIQLEYEDNSINVIDNKEELYENELGELNILLVEDNDINQLVAISVLENWKFKVSLAENGEEAVNMVSNNDYDIVLMDIHMPKMDGYEATQKIRTELNSKTPIVAMTASALIGENQKCFDVGMNDYISKPFDPSLLLEKITNQVKISKKVI